MIPVGFKQSETMRGYLRFLDAPEKEREVRFDCTYEVVDWSACLSTGETSLSGTFTCEDFVAEAPMAGKLFIDPLRRRKLIYDFTIDGPDSRPLRFYGEKRIDFLHLLSSMTTLYARLMDGDKVIATGVIRFELRDLPAFLASVRIFLR